MGRPRINIHWKEIEKLCILQCTQKEIAWFCDLSVDTLERACKREKKTSFADYYNKKKGLGAIRLRQAQWQVAIEGHNVAMLIFLGKQYLNQSDKFDVSPIDSDGFQFVTSDESKKDKK